MKYLVLAVALAVSASAFAKDVYVRGHVRKDGTYVAPHHRTSPDSTQNNNYGTVGNYNPYTGQEGRLQPQQPTYQPIQPIQPIQPLRPCTTYPC
jgi:hypothetical protein